MPPGRKVSQGWGAAQARTANRASLARTSAPAPANGGNVSRPPSDPAPGHPCKPVWVADWGRRENKIKEDHRVRGGGLEERAGLMASYPPGEPGLQALCLGYGVAQVAPVLAHRLQVPRCRWQGTCSPNPQSAPSPCPACLMPSSSVCARSVLSSWEVGPGA